MAGFSYRGKNIGEFGEIQYAPGASDRGPQMLPFEVNEEKAGERAGEYYYGNRAQARQFSLLCYYENLTQQEQNDMLRWFDRNTKGRLIFDDRDYVYYDVIPNQRVELENYRTVACDNTIKYTGMMTISLKAYCPFGKLISVDASAANAETLILPAAKMPGTAPM